MGTEFDKILDELRAMHDRKAEDYGKGEDGLANLRESAKMGIEPWIGTAIRLGDKLACIQSFIAKGKLLNESLEDSMIDSAVYSILMLILYRESIDKQNLESAGPGIAWAEGTSERDPIVVLRCLAEELRRTAQMGGTVPAVRNLIDVSKYIDRFCNLVGCDCKK